MRRPLLALAFVSLFAAGCVPVYHPIGDIDKSTPDKALVGTWSMGKRSGLALSFGEDDEIVIDAPAVKGNPKGLMRAVMSSNKDDEMWFFVATLDKRTYANTIRPTTSDGKGPSFAKEGAFAKWQDDDPKRYFVFRYSIDGDTLTINAGNHGECSKLMKAADIIDNGDKHVPYFLTKPKWADTVFAKGGADKVYDTLTVMELKRKKK